MSEIGLNQNSSSFYPPSPPGVHCHHETFFGRERSKPELKVGKFVEEDDSASQGESSDRLSVGSMSTAYWRVNSLAIVGAAIALISIFLRSDEHTSEFQSHHDLVCCLLLEKNKT